MVNKYQSEIKKDSESIFKRLLKDVKLEEMSIFKEYINNHEKLNKKS